MKENNDFFDRFNYVLKVNNMFVANYSTDSTGKAHAVKFSIYPWKAIWGTLSSVMGCKQTIYPLFPIAEIHRIGMIHPNDSWIWNSHTEWLKLQK